MASKILILSDDDGVLRPAADALGALGGIVATERSAEAALGRLLAGEADVAVIDADLPGGAGPRTANELQRRMGTLPVVLLAARERQDRVNENGQRRQATVGKPIRAEELGEAVRHALEPALTATTPGPSLPPHLPMAGQLRERPVHVVLGEICRRRATGVLDLDAPGFRARIFFEEGLVVSGTSNDPRTLAGYADVAADALPRAQLDAALAHVRSARVPLHEALRATGAFDDAALAAALSRQAAAVVVRSCSLPSGGWSFVEGERAPAVVARHHPLALALAGVRAAYPAPTIRAWLDRHRNERLAAHPELETLLAEAGISSALAAAALGASTAMELLTRLSEEELALLFTLAGFALLRFAPAATPGHGPRPPVVSQLQGEARKARQSAASNRGTPLSAEERRAVEAEDRRSEGCTWYEVLGLPPEAAPAAIKQAYFAAAKRWHSDAFAGRDLDGLAPLVERIFARVSEAHSVLSDPAKRAEYDVFLERKAKGLPTDVAAVLRAEEMFLKAQALYRTQRYADAEALLRQAVEINPAEAEFWAYLGASAYQAHGFAAAAQAREAFARARALIPRSLVTEYLEAQLEIGEGELDAAERRLRKILLDKPDHQEARRDLRTLRERKERESATGRGFLGTLWKRK